MDSLVYQIKTDMVNTGILETGIRLKQGDSGMIFSFRIFINGEEYYNEDESPEIWFLKPDGTTVQGQTAASTNRYVYTLQGNELEAVGTVRADIKFRMEDQRESSCSFKFDVENDTLGTSTKISGSYISSIEEAMADILSAAEEADERIDEIVADVQTKAEGSETSMDGYVSKAKAWAVGPSGTDTAGTDTNNAKYWAGVAQQAQAQGSGANEIDYDKATSTLSISRDGTVIDTTTIETIVDSALSDTSENPVQNKVVKASLDDKVETSSVISTLADISTKAAASGGLADSDVAGAKAIKDLEKKLSKYETTEKVVGEYYDGRPIYRKTYTGTHNAYSTSGNRRLCSNVLDTGIDLALHASGYISYVDPSNNTFKIPIYASAIDGNLAVQYCSLVNTSNGNLNLVAMTNQYLNCTGKEFAVTVDYVKL